MVIALVLNVFGHITRPWCNALLGLLNLLLTTILGDPTVEAGKSAQSGSGYLPSDIRTVRKKFDLDPSTHTYATCPCCCCTYPPDGGRGQSVYPERCAFKKYQGGKPCGHLLVKVEKHGGTKVTQPIKPFVVQDYGDFVAGLLSRPGMEEAMERGTLLNDKHQLWDIKDGTAITEVQGPDGKVFMDGLKRSDLRLAWSLSIDWFNPQGNKTAGKKKSVGSIAMTILNLPPSLRYKPENVYMVGVIPGPKEPSLEEINHFLRPLVDFFLAAWKVGTWFTKTTAHAMGRLVRSAIALVISDLPAARKISGFAAATSRHLCNLCWLQKSDIGDLDTDSWKRRTSQEYRDAAARWRDAETKKQRDTIFKEMGVCWSELLRLPYWDPTRFLAIDGMHNLLLGLTQFQFRDLIVIDQQENQNLRTSLALVPKPADPAELDKGRKILRNRPTEAALSRLCAPVLLALLEECDAMESLGSPQKRPRKNDMIRLLMVSYSQLTLHTSLT